ncbi:MAG: VOC family protein [Rhizobiaceae bacterium]|nr:VOC family protein [Rhizobiaceae bacterium]
MTANVSIVTLGVEDLTTSTSFYEKLGWANSSASQESVTFLQGHSVILGLYGRNALAEDAGVDPTGSGFRGVALAINLPDRQAVDGFFALAVSCGADATKQPQEVFWGGYSGYFADPDGHLWEVAHNPFVKMDPQTSQLTLEGTDK